MPALFDEQGNPVDASGMPEQQPAKTQEQKDALLYKILHGATIFGNEATMGAVPAIANLAAQAGMGKGASETIQKYLSEAEQDVGEDWTTGLKVAGALATPLPFGKVKGATTLGKIGYGALKGAGLGATSAALHNIGTAAPGEINPASLASEAALGAGMGGALGGALGGGAGYLAARAERSGLASAGGTAGRIQDAARNYPTSEYTGLNIAKDVIARGRDYKVPGEIKLPFMSKPIKIETTGIQGRFGQSFENVAERANKVAQKAGQAEEAILANEGRLIKIKTDIAKQHVLDPLIDELGAKGIIGRGNQRVINELEAHWNSMTKDKSAISIEQMAKMREDLSNYLQGAYGQMPLGQNLKVSYLAKLRSNISDLEDMALTHIVPEVGQKFVNAKQQYHSAMVLRAMATKGDISDLGLMETLLGRGIRGMANTAALTKLGLSGPLSYAATSAMAGGRIPNTVLSLDRLINTANKTAARRAWSPLTTQRAGMVAGQLAGTKDEF